jgi:hypothetical protein
MPVKDLTGPPLLTEEDKALLLELHQRLGMPLPKRRRYRGDDGLEPVVPPSGPKPPPLAGAA